MSTTGASTTLRSRMGKSGFVARLTDLTGRECGLFSSALFFSAVLGGERAEPPPRPLSGFPERLPGVTQLEAATESGDKATAALLVRTRLVRRRGPVSTNDCRARLLLGMTILDKSIFVEPCELLIGLVLVSCARSIIVWFANLIHRSSLEAPTAPAVALRFQS
jgi:hypothetical protein